MKFIIDSIIIWPKKSGLKYREVKFEQDKINIITGVSRTGKSALISIVDYCLGANKCSIPVDIIRDSSAWFGVLFSLENEQLLLCRKEPGRQSSTGEMYIKRAKDINIPDCVTSNITLTEVKNILNELFSISFLDIDSSSKVFLSRPSYRDFMPFIFQPQNIVANPDVLFFKADTMEHRQKLINIFPYILGAVTPQILAARQELERLRKNKERIERDIKVIQDVSENWKQEISSWLMQAKEMGLIDKMSEKLSFNEQVNLLSQIFKKIENNSTINPANIKDISSEIIKLRKEEHDISSQLFRLQKRRTEMQQLKDSVDKYESSLKIQLQRLEISSWLKGLSKSSGLCPICNNIHEDKNGELNRLCQAIEEIEKSTYNIKTMPAAFERELQLVDNDIAKCSEKLLALRKRILDESGTLKHNSDKKYTLSEISRFLGRLESSLTTFNKLGKDNDLEKQLSILLERINYLSQIVDEVGINNKQKTAIGYINEKIGEILGTLDVEYPEDPVEFLIKDLTLKIKNSNGRDDYLWEIGSASNWLSYHIATILAFQQFFQVNGGIAIPNFVIFDQPSQVYFPKHFKQSVNNGDEFSDEDKNAVKKIFTCMETYLNKINNQLQIIVVEHAESDIWGDIKSVHLVERWRDGDKLIPLEWM